MPIDILKKLNLVDISSLSKKNADNAPLSVETNTLLPPFTNELSGNNEVRIKNPNDFVVLVGIRAEN